MERKISKHSKICIECGKVFAAKKSHLQRRKYCSRVCFDLARKKTLVGSNNPCWRGGRPKCIDCKKTLTHWGHYDGKDSRCNSCRRKFASGINHYNWKGGITKESAKIRNSLQMKLWRKSVFERDSYKCIWCGSGGSLNADHIKPFAYFPELRFAIDNGRTLCVECHKKTDTYLSKVFKHKKCKKEI